MILDEKAIPAVSRSLSERLHLISLNLSPGSYSQLQDWIINAAHQRESRTVCCANVHMVIEAKQNPAIAEAVNSADWVTPDGVPLVWALRGLYGLRQDRIAGMDLAVSLLQRAADEGISVFFYGSTPQVLERLSQTCLERFPALQIAGVLSPPFRKTTPGEDNTISKQISDSGAGLVLVILGCPKQELWMAQMRGRIPAVMIGLGGALLVLAGFQTRAPLWMQQNGLEWLFRLAQEPRRLFKRYAVTNSLYIWYVGVQWITQRR
ncbi:WecB/TagA/CpsF family glycosyltransferase [Spirosoma flavum]|uniref:WecB/TagA/CpsF family glycosyltransferase n=1 Tax=Spirosoma flavum TaxID=2048557 RepID=A0ABW6AK40_9BACT